MVLVLHPEAGDGATSWTPAPFARPIWPIKRWASSIAIRTGGHEEGGEREIIATTRLNRCSLEAFSRDCSVSLHPDHRVHNDHQARGSSAPELRTQKPCFSVGPSGATSLI